MRHYLVTGGAGFIGSEFVRQVASRRDTKITVVDSLTYAGNLENISDVYPSDIVRFYQLDIAKNLNELKELIDDVTHVINFAAESHVDRSIDNPRAFLDTAVIGVFNLLEACKGKKIRFLQVSTDEVYGSIEVGYASEEYILNPRSPYAASKTASEHLVRSYGATYGLDYIITRGSNTYGCYQYLEKMVPLFITNALDHQEIPLYGNGRQIRDWLHVSDHANGIEYALLNGAKGETYNIPGMKELENIEVAKKILKILGKPENLIRYVEDRPGHDIRYAMVGDKLESIGWTPIIDFDYGLEVTIDWYIQNQNWWRRIHEKGFKNWYNNRYQTKILSDIEE